MLPKNVIYELVFTMAEIYFDIFDATFASEKGLCAIEFAIFHDSLVPIVKISVTENRFFIFSTHLDGMLI